MVALSISHNFPTVQHQLDQLRADIAKHATARALNRTVESARTDMVREIRKSFNVSTTYVRERLAIRRATFKAGAFVMTAELRGTDKRSANVIAFMEKSATLAEGRRRVKAEGKRPELRFKIKRIGGKQVIRGAFIGNKGRTVFRRTGPGRRDIEPVQTISVASMFNAQRVNDVVTRAMLKKFPRNFEREVRFYTAKFKGSE